MRSFKNYLRNLRTETVNQFHCENADNLLANSIRLPGADRWTGPSLFASDFSDAKLVQCKFSNTRQAKNPLRRRFIVYDYQQLPSRIAWRHSEGTSK